jgi:hypothetical protein
MVEVRKLSNGARAALVLGIAALFGCTMLFAACGSGSGPDQEEIAHFKKQGAEHVHKEERLRKLEKELKHIKHKGSGGESAPLRTESSAGSPTPTATPTREPCGGELEVNSYTTCPFAEDVEAAYFAELGSGGGNVEAYSPVTHQTYVMYCTGSPHECTGGNNAAVYFP